MMADQDPRSIGELLGELSRETGVLVRKEVELATTEMTAKAKEAVADAGIAAAGGALAHAGFLVLLAAFVIGLARLGVEPWLSALMVALVTIAIGYLLVNRGVSRLRRISPAPSETIHTLKETAAWTTRHGV
jgi:xanthine/uracil permease